MGWKRVQDEWPDFGSAVLATYKTRHGKWVPQVVWANDHFETICGKIFPATHWAYITPPQD